MNATERKNEIIQSMPSFSKESYYKSELLPELLQLQSELVNLTFNGEHAENAQLRTWDVLNHLTKLNEERGHVADEQLQRFTAGCKIVNEKIRSELSGNKGEYKAMRSIETLCTPNTTLRNIELSSGDHQTELDIIVFTSKAIFVVEVKNPMRDITIDERGNYCRISGDRTKFDKNIGEKMNDKTFLLREVLKKAGIENPNIVSLLVFTNNNITVTNNFPFIHHCFLSSLPHLIDSYEGESLYSEESISRMAACTEAARYYGSYALPIDVNQFKQDFADLMVTLENATEEAPKEIAEPVKEETITVNTVPLWIKRVSAALTLVPVAGLFAMAAITMDRLYRK